MSDRLASSDQGLRVVVRTPPSHGLMVRAPKVAHVGYTGTDEDRDRRLQISLWLRRNDAALYRAWFEPAGVPRLLEDFIDMNGMPRRDFLVEDLRYDVVVTHDLWGFPNESELGGYGPAAASRQHGVAQWRRRLEACGARYIFLFGTDFHAGNLGGNLHGYDDYFVPSTSFLTVMVAQVWSRQLGAAAQRISYQDMACARLEHLPDLLGNRVLDLSYTGVTSRHLILVKEMRHLEDLRLVGTSVGDNDLAMIARCHALRRLNLDASAISGAGLAHLQKMQALECLSVNETNVDDAGLRHVGQLLRLQWLSLVGTAISDAGLDYLASLKSLRSLTLVQTRATAARVERLRKDLPDCAVDFRR